MYFYPSIIFHFWFSIEVADNCFDFKPITLNRSAKPLTTSKSKINLRTAQQRLIMADTKQPGCIPKRYILSMMIFMGFFIMYGLRVNLNVAIGAMAKNHTIFVHGKPQKEVKGCRKIAG